VGFASAAYFYGDGSRLTGLTAMGDNLGNHTATAMLNMGGYGIANAASGTFTNGVTASSFTATGAGVSASRVTLADNVSVSSETDTALGGGVRISTNTYIVGFASAAYFYGDGSRLTGLTAIGDNLGNHTATATLNMNGYGIVNAASGTFINGVTASSFTATGAGVSASRVTLADNVSVSSETDTALGGGVRISTNTYIVGFASAAYFYGDGSRLTGLTTLSVPHAATHDVGGSDTILDLGPHNVSGAITFDSVGELRVGGTLDTLSIAANALVRDNLTVGGSVTASSFTATGAGVSASRVTLADNVSVSSETDTALGGGVRISTNTYIVGFASAAYFYGNGSQLTGIAAEGDNLGNHIATMTLNMNGQSIVNAASGTFSGSLTAYSTVTILAPETEASSLWVSTSNVTPHLYVSTGGNVGVGTANPSADLEVAGTAAAGGYISLWKSGNNVAAWLRNK
jgi:hypothetical protein